MLTTPIIRCLKTQGENTVHYLVKNKYEEVLKKNPYIDKIYSYNKKKELKTKLREEKYDYIIDLQNNLKSFLLRKQIQIKKEVVNKKNIQKWILINTGKDFLKNEHVVERYFKTIKPLGISNDGKGLDFFIDENIVINENILPEKIIENSFITWALGATYSKKKLSEKHIVNVLKKIDKPVLLLGGINEKPTANKIISMVNKEKVYDLCGKLSLEESSFLIKKSEVLLTNDTGLMHIGSALKKKIISFWGCTKPSLGMSPYKPDELSVQMVSNPLSPPCSKLGNRCRKSKTACINNISSDEIYEELLKIVKK